jgi:hypothetical protein
MSDLLTRVIDAHGGLERWRGFSTVEATIVTGGALWGMKGLVQTPEPRRMTVALHEQRASVFPYGEPHWRTAFTPERIAIETLSGEVVRERFDPRASFDGHDRDTPWDPLHRAYFNGYALWTYLTTPFLMLMPGVEVNEVTGRREAGETWRALRCRFPPSIATHSAEQTFYFGEDCLLRRHDYNVDVAGGFLGAQLVFDYVEVQGLRQPTRRRAYVGDARGEVIADPVMVSIDVSDIRYS